MLLWDGSLEVKQQGSSRWGVHLVVFDMLSTAESLPKVTDNEHYDSLIKVNSVRKSIQIALNKNTIFGPSQIWPDIKNS